MLYLFAIVIVFVKKKKTPAFGLTNDFLIAADYAAVKTTAGIFTNTPHVSLCFGVVYFTGMALTILLPSIYLISH